MIGGSTRQYILSCLEWASEYRISILGVSRHFFSDSITTIIPLGKPLTLNQYSLAILMIILAIFVMFTNVPLPFIDQRTSLSV